MSHDHPHHDHDHASPVPGPAIDSGSQALTEALRGSFVIVKFVMLALLAVFIFSGFFSVGDRN